MMDVTAILMRDPSTRSVRAPTPYEQHRAHVEQMGPRGRPAGTKWLGARGKLLDPLQIGGSVVAPTEAQARNYARWFLEHGRRASIKRRSDGDYAVTRVF